MKTLLGKDNPILRAGAAPVEASEFNTPELSQLVEEMFQIMEEKGAVGVAAPQIGISKQVIVFGTNYTRRRKIDTPIPNTVLVNPKLTFLSEEKTLDYEGCLNSGELMGQVPRSIEVEYSGFDIEGNPVTKRATGLEARIIQHEVDHLNGILFFDHVENEEDFTTYTELSQRL